MLRSKLIEQKAGLKPGWRWRGHEISRIEGFSDAVFAFAITLLVVSLEVPKTFQELYDTMRGFLSFAISFALLFQLWHSQYTFFRRYGLQDGMTILLNSMLLFMVLFYVYPLKFLFNMLVIQFSGGSLLVKGHDGQMEEMLTDAQAPTLMVIYGLGVFAVFAFLALMHWHALRKREELELSKLELFDTRTSVWSHGYSASVGVTSVLIAKSGFTGAAFHSGMLYAFAMPIGHTLLGMLRGRKKRRLLNL